MTKLSITLKKRDTQHNDTHQNNIWHNAIKPNDTQSLTITLKNAALRERKRDIVFQRETEGWRQKDKQTVQTERHS